MSDITLKFQDGKTIQTEPGSILWDVVKEAYPKAHDKIVAAHVNSVLTDLQTPLNADAAITPVRVDTPDGMNIFWHSSSHVMAQAVQAIYPDAKLGIGPSIENGFYYDFEIDATITPEDLEKIESEINRIVDEDQIFEKMDKLYLSQTLIQLCNYTVFDEEDLAVQEKDEEKQQFYTAQKYTPIQS